MVPEGRAGLKTVSYKERDSPAAKQVVTHQGQAGMKSWLFIWITVRGIRKG